MAGSESVSTQRGFPLPPSAPPPQLLTMLCPQSW